MSYSRRRDYRELPQSEETGPAIVPTDDDIKDEEPVKKKFYRSASIAISPDTNTNLSFILDMDREEATEYTQTLHDDVDKLFEEVPKFSFEALTSGAPSVASERSTIEEDSHNTADRHFDERDFKSHRRASFPHAHVPLKSLPKLKSSKPVSDLRESEKKKKKPKKKKQHVFPSKIALVSEPSIPEVEEYQDSDGSLFIEDEADEDFVIHDRDTVDSGASLALSVPTSVPSSTTVSSVGAQPVNDNQTSQSVPHQVVSPSDSTDETGTQLQHRPVSEEEEKTERAAAFYIGFHPDHDGSPARDNIRSLGSSVPNQDSEIFDQEGIIITLNDDETPLVSPISSRRQSYDQAEPPRVTFQLGGEQAHDSADDVWIPQSSDQSNNSLQPQPPKPSKSDTRLQKHKRHHHHHHHDRFKREDLLLRRQKGSDVQLSDALKRVPTETEEAMMLHKADLDDMASHRRADVPGMRRHKIARKKHNTVSSVVHVGKSSKSGVSRKIFKPFKKKYDHSPHEVFVELDELYEGENRDKQWREMARWIKFEEDVEEGAQRWGKPHVASLSFHSLLELRKGLENGSLLLDLEATDLPSIVHHLVENMVIHDQIRSEVKGEVMRTLLMKHKFVGEDRVKSMLRHSKSVQNLFGLDSQRHQREQLSMMKTFSSASFTKTFSSNNLLPAQQHGRSLSVPNDNHYNNQTNKNRLEVPNGDHGNKKFEFVKVDVDNNMPTTDGIHIGIVPQESQQEHKDQRPIQDIMRRIPRGAEACTVLVGCVEYLEKPAMGFVRLAESQILENLTEVPLPVRFLFVLLGPEKSGMDFHEVGRSISTLMSNQHFHDIVYKAETRSEILHAINEFLNESIVLPPGDWDQKTLLPIMDMARKRARLRRRKMKKQEELEALIQKEEKEKVPMDPLKRTGRLFGGLINDIKRRYPHYASDFYDALNLQCVMAFIFIFFACLAPCIAFGGLYSEKTDHHMGVTEMVLSTSLTGVVFGLFSTQPLMLMGATGPVLVFEKQLYSFCKSSHIEFLPWRVWIGLWVFIITLFVLAVEGSFLVRYITRFTEEVFAMLISLIFIVEVINKLQRIYEDNPLKTNYCDSSVTNKTDKLSQDTNNLTTAVIVDMVNTTVVSVNNTLFSTKVDYSADKYVEPYPGHYSRRKNEPNTALLSTILIFGTFLIAYFLRVFRNSTFLGRSARRALGDFGLVIAIVLMVLFDYFCADTYTTKLDLPDTFGPTDRRARGWYISPLGIKMDMQVWHMFVAVIPAFLLFILLFLEVQLTEMLLHKKEFKMKKGSGFHMEQFLSGLMTFILSLFGLPWLCAATVRTIAHVNSLSVMSRTHAPGEKPKLIEVKEQRVTSIVLSVMIGTSLTWGPVLRSVPLAVLFGVFLYLGLSAISGVQLFKRFKLLFVPVKHHPSISFVRRVPTVKMHIFTVLQIILVAILYIVKSTPAAIVFPLLVFLMIPLRLKVLPKVFTHSELEALDKEEEDSDDEDLDPDFYQQAHMPI